MNMYEIGTGKCLAVRKVKLWDMNRPVTFDEVFCTQISLWWTPYNSEASFLHLPILCPRRRE